MSITRKKPLDCTSTWFDLKISVKSGENSGSSGRGYGWGAISLPFSPDGKNFVTAAALKFIVVFVAFTAAFAAERRWPVVAWRLGANRIGRNLSLAFVNFLMGPALVVPVSIYAASHSFGFRPAWWNIALDLVLLDLWIYGWHRLNHVIPFLWRFHEVHHRDEMLDVTSALRFHFGEVALSALVRAVMIWLFSIPLQSVLAFETVVVLAAIFHHSNLRLPAGLEGLLSRLIVTPGLHWVHHHAQRADTDSNYATVLSIWDVLFKSRSPNHRQIEMKLGVEGQSDLALPQLLVRPFTQRQS